MGTPAAREPSNQASHPAVDFKAGLDQTGPLQQFEDIRDAIVENVIDASMKSLEGRSTDGLVSEALYSEKRRLKVFKPNIFTRPRFQADKRLWAYIQGQLLKPATEAPREHLLEDIVSVYAEEIAAHFDSRVHRFAIKAVPWFFNWLLNAASVQRFLPWGLTKALENRLHLIGEIPLLQKLATKGTILLVPTHQSNLDSLLVGYMLHLCRLPPFAYGAGLNLFSNPILSFFMSKLGAYTVDRAKQNYVYKETLKQYSVEILRSGVHSIFFPGGGRSRSGAIEHKLKLGLLGTALEAQLKGYLEKREKPKVFLFPMVLSYHFVLEAGFMIEDYLADMGKHRYLTEGGDGFDPIRILRFFWKGFSSETAVTARIGRPLDVFGNFVDEEGMSIGPNGRTIDPTKWLTTGGQLRLEPQRDHEYTRELGVRLVERFHTEHTVLSSQAVAFVFFETLRKKYPDFDLYRLLRLTMPQRTLTRTHLFQEAEQLRDALVQQAAIGKITLDPMLRKEVQQWFQEGTQQLGLYHDAAVVKMEGELIWTEDMNLLYYYRNRLTGFGLTLLKDELLYNEEIYKHDTKGFLA